MFIDLPQGVTASGTAAISSTLLAVLGRLLVRLYLTARHERLDLEPYLQDGQYRRGDGENPMVINVIAVVAAAVGP